MYKVPTAPSQEIFDDMLQAATTVWKTYNDEHGYVTGKLNYINSINNIQDNSMVMYRMFDSWNQRKMITELKLNESIDYIKNNN